MVLRDSYHAFLLKSQIYYYFIPILNRNIVNAGASCRSIVPYPRGFFSILVFFISFFFACFCAIHVPINSYIATAYNLLAFIPVFILESKGNEQHKAFIFQANLSLHVGYCLLLEEIEG